MAILAPLQEGMQALPSEEVANERARALSKVNLGSVWPDDLRQALERGLFCPLQLDDIPGPGVQDSPIHV